MLTGTLHLDASGQKGGLVHSLKRIHACGENPRQRGLDRGPLGMARRWADPQLDAPHRGMFPCLRGAGWACLVRLASSAAIRAGRVRRGAITSST
jgi:hypothetical protein